MQKSSTKLFKISRKKMLQLLIIRNKKNLMLLGSILALEVNMGKKYVTFVTLKGRLRKLKNMSNTALNIFNMFNRMMKLLMNTLVSYVENQALNSLVVCIII